MNSLKYVNLFGSLIILGILVIAILQKRIKIKSSQIIETPTVPPTEPEDMTTEQEESITEANDETETSTDRPNGLFILSIVTIGCMTLINVFLVYMNYQASVTQGKQDNDSMNSRKQANDSMNSRKHLIFMLTVIACVLCAPGLIASIIVKNWPFMIVHIVLFSVNFFIELLSQNIC